MNKNETPKLEDEFIVELMREVKYFLDKLGCENTQEIRRAFCRAVFQFVDGTATILKKDIAYYESPNLIGDELYLSCFDKIKNKNNGKEKEVIQKRGFADNLAFAFDVFGFAAGVNLNIKKNQKEWQRFKSCILVRNRVVHPKSLSDLTISNNELAEMVKMYSWLENALIHAHHEYAMSFLKQAHALKKGWINRNSKR